MGGFGAVLRRCGRPMSVWRGGRAQTGLAMVQPLLEKNEQWLPTPLGCRREDRFLCLAAPELELGGLDVDFVEWDGARFNVAAAHAVELEGRTLYQWAVLTPRDQDAQQ